MLVFTYTPSNLHDERNHRFILDDEDDGAIYWLVSEEPTDKEDNADYGVVKIKKIHKIIILLSLLNILLIVI